MTIRFIIYGMLGWCGEIIWTATREKLSGQQRDWKLRGTTYLWMFPLYGLIAPLYEPVHNALRTWPWPLRGVVYMLGFWAVEYLTGWLLKRVIGVCPWDYSRARWHVHTASFGWTMALSGSWSDWGWNPSTICWCN